MTRFFVLFLIAAMVSSCRNKATKSVEVTAKSFMIDGTKHQVDSLLLGKNDTAFVVKNKLNDDDIGADQKSYEINIIFSNVKWPTLHFEQAIGADLYLVSDMNQDGKPELLLRPEWFNSCWSSINLFTLKDNAWKLIKKDSMYFCSEEYPLSKRIEKQGELYYLLTDSLADDKFVINKKEIQF